MWQRSMERSGYTTGAEAVELMIKAGSITISRNPHNSKAAATVKAEEAAHTDKTVYVKICNLFALKYHNNDRNLWTTQLNNVICWCVGTLSVNTEKHGIKP